MKHILLTCLIYFSITTVFAQRISKVKISYSGTTEMFSVETDDKAVINISTDGNIISYGIEYFSEKIANYSRLEKYNGRIDMYTATDDAALQGKLKYLGRTAVTYYPSYEIEGLRGKIKSIGSLNFTYFMQYDDVILKGKIKSIGNQQINFYSSFDNEALRGKLKSVGSTTLSYYSSFDDKAFKGKIKNIGQVNFTYYPSYDIQYAGSMKTGNQTQIIAGINYFIQ